jgi:hypothetical protein
VAPQMRLKFSDHMSGLTIAKARFSDDWKVLVNALEGISDHDLIAEFSCKSEKAREQGKSPPVGLQSIVNSLIRSRLEPTQWEPERRIFSDPEGRYKSSSWRLDFATKDLALEVAFNNGGSTGWNLLKPMLACHELNAVPKDNNWQLGVVVFATEQLKSAGNMDSTVHTFERVSEMLRPLALFLNRPLCLIGLQTEGTFLIHRPKGKSSSIVLTDDDRQ